MSIAMPTIEEVKAELERIAAFTDFDDLGQDDDGYLDVRLRVFEGDWEVKFGDSQYDTDHRGSWGYASICEDSDLSEVAQELIDEVSWDEAINQALSE